MLKTNNSSLKSIYRLWSLLELKFKQRTFLLMLLMLVSGFAELVTMGSIVPFLAVLIDSTSVLQYPYIGDFLQYLNIDQEKDLILFFSLVFIVAIFLSAILRLFISRINLLWCYELISYLSIAAFERTLYQPYLKQVLRNSSELVAVLTAKISSILTGVMLPLIAGVQVIILIISIITALMLILPLSNVIALTAFSLLYALVSLLLRKKYTKNSKIIAQEQVKAIKVLQESLAGIRDIILGNYYDEYINQYANSRKLLDRTSGTNAFLIVAPKFIIESLGIVLIVLLVLYNYGSSIEIAILLPSLGALALGAQRLLPYLQQLYAAYSTIISSSQSVIDALDILEQPMIMQEIIKNHSQERKLDFNKVIQLDNLSFQYSEESDFELKNLNLNIEKGDTIGIIGTTGGGKSTLIDLLMGLIQPKNGNIFIDERELEESLLVSWQKNLSHVPQNIVLTDNSIKQNIALGQADDDISISKVKEVLIKAQMKHFIDSLPDGIETKVGERGVRLSGGQRQRIGIARALYQSREILFLDEATNALDMKTEDKILEIIRNIKDDLTLIIVAHNIDTIKDCDKILIMDSGSIAEAGSFDEIKNTEVFKRLTGIMT
jgi:ATP-binding cassette, subfamily B, bacterial PglK